MNYPKKCATKGEVTHERKVKTAQYESTQNAVDAPTPPPRCISKEEADTEEERSDFNLESADGGTKLGAKKEEQDRTLLTVVKRVQRCIICFQCQQNREVERTAFRAAPCAGTKMKSWVTRRSAPKNMNVLFAGQRLKRCAVHTLFSPLQRGS